MVGTEFDGFKKKGSSLRTCASSTRPQLSCGRGSDSASAAGSNRLVRGLMGFTAGDRAWRCHGTRTICFCDATPQWKDIRTTPLALWAEVLTHEASTVPSNPEAVLIRRIKEEMVK